MFPAVHVIMTLVWLWRYGDRWKPCGFWSRWASEESTQLSIQGSDIPSLCTSSNGSLFTFESLFLKILKSYSSFEGIISKNKAVQGNVNHKSSFQNTHWKTSLERSCYLSIIMSVRTCNSDSTIARETVSLFQDNCDISKFLFAFSRTNIL